MDTLDGFDRRASEMLEIFQEEFADCDAAARLAFDQLEWALSQAKPKLHMEEIGLVALAARTLQAAHPSYAAIRSGNDISVAFHHRSILETVFAIASIAKAKEVGEHVNAHERLLYKARFGAKKAVENFLKAAVNLNDHDKSELEDFVRLKEAELADLAHSKLTDVATLANNAALTSYYRNEYAADSEVVHSSVEQVVTTHTKIDGESLRTTALVLSHGYARTRCAELVTYLMLVAEYLRSYFVFTLTLEAQERFYDTQRFCDGVYSVVRS